MTKFHHAPPPAFSPERDTEYLSEGEEIARVAHLLGLELMPWQKHVADIATEYTLDDEGNRIYHYKTVLVTVPRQSGKTTLMTPVRLHRIMTRPGIDAFSTAQTGKAARDRILKMVETVETSPLAPLFKSLRSNGAEGLQVRSTRSRLVRFSPVAGAIHGETPYFVDLDEIWKFTAELGDTLLGGIRPSMITLGNRAQIWMVSTKGTAQSDFMNRYIEAGEKGTDHSLAYFAWQMPDGADPDDPATWWRFHPALGNTISEDTLREDMYADGMTYGERIRAYMNLITTTQDAIIPAETWDDMKAEPAPPALSDVAVGVEVAAGGTCAAVVAAWRTDNSHPHVHVLHQAPGTAWVAPYLENLHTHHGVEWVAADDGGPVRAITDALAPLDESKPETVPVRRLSLPQRQTADVTLLTAARDEQSLTHDGSQALAQAVAAAQLRTSNGVERIDRDKSLGPVPALIAASVALWAYDHPADQGAEIPIL
ncbi:terminase TerL endonuclease subunit [Schaalia sp. ZJ1691]|uniref:terminase TerL endonuclease subunit n=1 Tax=Schaalia sp. ZJ1691 TaxID=2709404 RepID=UPI0013EA6555|nr:terminase TerL endonuclease subunit [Schaalia sp. ZJ1691]